MLCFRVLTDYQHLLEDWKVRYAPKTPDEPYDDRFVEACQMHCHIEYMADVLTVGDLEERVALVDKLMQDGKIKFLLDYCRLMNIFGVQMNCLQFAPLLYGGIAIVLLVLCGFGWRRIASKKK